MKIEIKVIPSSKKEEILSENQGVYLARVKAPAKEGKANKALIGLLAKYFDLPKSRFVLKSGKKSRNKIVEIS